MVYLVWARFPGALVLGVDLACAIGCPVWAPWVFPIGWSFCFWIRLEVKLQSRAGSQARGWQWTLWSAQAGSFKNVIGWAPG